MRIATVLWELLSLVQKRSASPYCKQMINVLTAVLYEPDEQITHSAVMTQLDRRCSKIVKTDCVKTYYSNPESLGPPSLLTAPRVGDMTDLGIQFKKFSSVFAAPFSNPSSSFHQNI